MEASPLAAPPKVPLPNSYWVLPERLLAGEYPGGASPEATRARLQRLLDAGVGFFLDLTQPGELEPYHAELPVSVEYLRKPIPDHALPDKREHMAEILECLWRALRARRAVYLHCRAGIGRTGTVAGCLLVERGLSGEEALTELNLVWQQSERSAQWPRVPETPAQVDYVRSWTVRAGAEPDPLLEPATLAAARGMRERYLGALLGLAVGDALAAASQYRRPGRFAPVGDLLGGGPFDLPRGGWSDDTAMALCLAESLLECSGFEARDQVARYHRWQQEGYLSATGQCVGITAGTARALAMAQWRRQVFSGSHDPQVLDPEPLSRVAPVVMYFFAHLEVAVEQAAQAARTTCQAPRVLTACRTLARALHSALSGQPREGILAYAAAALEEAGSEGTVPAASGASAPAALVAAFGAFERTRNFRDAVLAAANLGGHSDVVAAACGALAGAHYTAGAIPTLWRNSLMKQQLIEGCADRLLTHALVTLSG
ncbi:MAG: ADP-ribosylglycohydrolase family protein [Steroidobacteraceae bacterium]